MLLWFDRFCFFVWVVFVVFLLDWLLIVLVLIVGLLVLTFVDVADTWFILGLVLWLLA